MGVEAPPADRQADGQDPAVGVMAGYMARVVGVQLAELGLVVERAVLIPGSGGRIAFDLPAHDPDAGAERCVPVVARWDVGRGWMLQAVGPGQVHVHARLPGVAPPPAEVAAFVARCLEPEPDETARARAEPARGRATRGRPG